jgi:hypothetical protein
LRTRLEPWCARTLCVMWCLLGLVGCATFVPLTPERVDRVPAGRYHVMVSEDRTGVRKYNALLFEMVNASVTLDLPTVEPGGVASPEDYPAALQAGFVAYEVRAASGAVQAYLLVPARARVTVWNQPSGKGGLVVSVSGLPATPETAGSGGSGGM